MKDFFKFRQELTEGRVTMAKLKPGMKVSVIHKGRSAKNYGVDGEDVYGGKGRPSWGTPKRPEWSLCPTSTATAWRSTGRRRSSGT